MSAPVLRRLQANEIPPGWPGTGEYHAFYCPGCGCGHWFRTEAPPPPAVQLDPAAIEPADAAPDAASAKPGQTCDIYPVWEIVGDLSRPTVSPSIFVLPDTEKACHSRIFTGTIQFYDDCWHAMKGMTVPLEPV